MAEQTGLFIVIEGTDGSGKGTQFALLAERLRSQGYDVATFDFPEYDSEASYFVRQYLNGQYGESNDVGPYTASLFFALNRYDAARRIRQAMDDGKVVLANRFTGSNMAHQGGKFARQEERRGFFIWLDNLEFQMLGVPRPDVNFILRVPAEIAQQLVDKKEKRSYTSRKRDIHEADLEHLRNSVETYDDLAKLFPKDFTVIEAVKKGELLPIERIQQLLWDKVEPLLPDKPQHKPKSAKEGVQRVENPYVQRKDTGWEITPEGQQFLSEAVTDTTGNVYAFTDKLGSLTIAAAMARLSRRGDDMRITILDEFAVTAGKD
ncbi:MAG TPA: thymidylate kinase, partial [Candidatus Saccharimonadales bacterium]|nr:thymidylate kinase [Candidatus Saccharimonadales bacterium]